MGWGNNRAVSEVLGAILLFGIVVLALGSYQAFVVPQQNAEIESNHDAQVSNEFAEIQPAISNAAASGRTRTTSVTLGTRYPVRAAALNPPTVSGQLSTGPSGDVVVENDGSPVDACALDDSREDNTVLRYKANYNELGGTGALVYENGITYRETDGNRPLVKNDQQLIDENTIRLFPLVSKEFSTASSGSESLQFYPGETGIQTFEVASGDQLNISFPSQLSDTEWERILEDADATKSGNTITVTLTPSDDTEYTVRCTPVGLGSSPKQNDPPEERAYPNPSGEINPAGTVKLEGQSLDKPNSAIEMTFKAVDESVNFSETRYSFFYAGPGGGNISTMTNMTGNGDGGLSENAVVGEGYVNLNSSIEITESGTTVTAKFDNNPNQKNLFGITFIIEETGERAQYIIGV
ncbi:hypothetical protein [Natronomonas gomsonensis]|uniref:DUF7289 family protein n=1 Tax=Natronomonas gomsonensis TaxID=1046043 RepID=UPI0015B8FAD5|nr:hypothetical protein [Natronomonas gomsonensis]